MAYHVIAFRVKKFGFCCEVRYFIAVQHLSTAQIAAELGVHKRTVRRWRAEMRESSAICPHTTEKPRPPLDAALADACLPDLLLPSE